MAKSAEKPHIAKNIVEKLSLQFCSCMLFVLLSLTPQFKAIHSQIVCSFDLATHSAPDRY